MSDLRVKADKYISENRAKLNDTYRLKFHLMGEVGWINDPNGFVQFQDQYHMFYQHYPYDAVWGPMYWGHAVSRDLVKWDYLPIALAPDQTYDRDGCFSGSGIEKDGRLYLFYTGHVNPGHGEVFDVVQQQCMALSEDGVIFEKYPENPVVRTDEIPIKASRQDFRDPKVVKIGDKFFMTIGSHDDEGHGQALLYVSDDLVHWQFKNVLAKSDGMLGNNWECPDLFLLNGRPVLVVSPQNVDPKQFFNSNTSLYLLGELDVEEGVFATSSFDRLDFGFDFYAPQSMVDDAGRRVVVGWMNTWGNPNPTHENGHGWAGALTFPREIVQVGERLHFRPVQEIERYRHNEYVLPDMTLSGDYRLDATGDCYELHVIAHVRSADEFSIKLRVGKEEKTVLTYRPQEERFDFDRNAAGIGPKGVASTSVKAHDGVLDCRVLVDKCSVEVFLNDGEKAMTGLIYPDESSLGIELFAVGEVRIESLHKWDIVL